MRLERITSGTAVKLAYDGLDRIAEYDGSNALLRRYVHGPGMDEPIVWYEGTGTTDRRFLSSDERGSVISVTNSAGALLGINTYDEYGNPGASNVGAFGYTGQAWLPSIGAYYYKARVYDPELGRFYQPDPIGYYDGPNLYAYVLNDPVNLIDPLGLDFIQTCHTHSYSVGTSPPKTSTVCTFINIPGTGGQSVTFNPGRTSRQPVRIASSGASSKRNPCIIPSGGPGVSQLHQNIQVAEMHRRGNAGAQWSIFAEPALELGTGAWFVTKVKSGGDWDYKNQGYPKGQNFGNFNYGATAAALGFDWEGTIGAAHAYSLIDTGTLESQRDFIRAGYEYYRSGCAKQ